MATPDYRCRFQCSSTESWSAHATLEKQRSFAWKSEFAANLEYEYQTLSNNLYPVLSNRDPAPATYIKSTQALKTRWQGHPLQALIEILAKNQALKARWQGHPLQALVEILAKTQALKARWQGHPL